MTKVCRLFVYVLFLSLMLPLPTVARQCDETTAVQKQNAVPEYILKIQQRQREMLNTTVLVRSKNSIGSGTVVFSDRRNGEWETYIQTVHHVIDKSIVPKKDDEGVTVGEELHPVQVTLYEYKNLGRNIKQHERIADIVAYDEEKDLALLRLRDDLFGWKYAAHVSAPYEYLLVTQKSWIVGAGLGRPPFPTDGVISAIDKDRDGNGTFILASAPIINGNSGGGLYIYDEEEARYELVGVVRHMGVTAIGGKIVMPVAHMAFSVHVDSVRAFLKNKGFEFILGPNMSPMGPN